MADLPLCPKHELAFGECPHCPTDRALWGLAQAYLACTPDYPCPEHLTGVNDSGLEEEVPAA